VKYPVVQLGDICDEIYRYPSFYGMEHLSTGIPVIRGEHIDAWGSISQDWDDYWFVSEEVSSQFPRTVLREGDLVFTVRGTIGKVGLITKSHDGAQLSPNLIRFSPKREVVDTIFLWYFLQSIKETAAADIQNEVTIASVRASDLSELKIPLPPLTEQKRIASLLARADRLRQLRRTAHDLGDALLQSVFLEMFGDALTGRNPKIPLVPLETLCTKITDGTHVTPTYLDDGVPFLSVKNITRFRGQLDFSDIKYISPEEHKKISKLSNVERGDILYTKVGATYGYAQIVDTDREFSIFVSVALLKPNKSKILPKFFEVVMNSVFVKEQADRLVSGIGVPDLHLREIKTFQIPLPPLSLQEEFAGVVARVESLRGRMGESTRQVEGLFESLLAEAFSA
jgi:type I restriction enzyme, S subunit